MTQNRFRATCGAVLFCLSFMSCGSPDSPEAVKPVVDQLGRTVSIPARLDRIAALHHFGGKIVYALNQQDKLVEQAIYGKEAKALSKLDSHFASLPGMIEGHDLNIEGLVALRPQVVFVYASNDRSEMQLLENAGISVIAIKGETLEQSFAAVELVAKVLNCPEKGRTYIDECRRLLDMVQQRIADIPPDKRPKVMFTGPRSIYSLATGEMLQTEILERAGATNVAKSVKGFWADVSPEQIAVWNPDVIFLGSSLDIYDMEMIYQNGQFDTVKAVQRKQVYVFPSTIGWWDYPAPHCVLGVVWSAKTLYPERFSDVDILSIADTFYTRYIGYSFTEMGGKL